MLDPDDRARIEKLESMLGVLIATVSSQAMAGDVTGSTMASVLSKIQALAGGGNQLVGVNNGGDIIAAPTVFPLAGDVTGNTSASVITKIVALAGSGTRMLAVDNGGNVIAIASVPGAPLFFTMSGVAPANAASDLHLDVDLTAFNDSTVVIEARVIETTKNGGPHLTDSAFMPAAGVFNNKNGSVSLGTSAAGGAAGNPFNSQPQYLQVYPETSDANLRSGGFQPLGAVWNIPGGAIARLVVTNPGPVAGDVLTYFTLYPKAA